MENLNSSLLEIAFTPQIVKLRDFAFTLGSQEFIKAIVRDGGRPFIVGGFVRDMLLNKDPKDIDILVQGMTTDDIQKSIAGLGKIDIVGESFAVIKFKPHSSDLDFDIAAPRTEKKIGTGHKGFEIISTRDILVEQDLERRDFTINSMAFDIVFKELVDPFHGLDDLAARQIKMTNPAAFIDDALRILRGVQFAARFNMSIEPATFQLMKDNISLLKEISGERMYGELVKIFEKHGSSQLTFRMLVDIGFHKTFELRVNKHMTINDIEIKSVGDFFSTILGHIDGADEMFVKIFKGDIKTKKQLQALQTQFQMLKLVDGNKNTPDRMIPLIAAAMVKITDDTFSLGYLNTGVEAILIKMKSGELPAKIKDLAISGDDVKGFGFEGKPVGVILSKLFELVITGSLANDRELLLSKLSLFTEARLADIAVAKIFVERSAAKVEQSTKQLKLMQTQHAKTLLEHVSYERKLKTLEEKIDLILTQ